MAAAVNVPVLWVPLVDLLPFHPPDATQAVAFVAVQVNIAAAPLVSVVGEAFRASVGVGADAGSAASPPPHAARDIAPTQGQILQIRIGQEASKASRQRCDTILQQIDRQRFIPGRFSPKTASPS